LETDAWLLLSPQSDDLLTDCDVLGFLLREVSCVFYIFNTETWSLTPREEHMRVFESKMLRISGLKKEEVTG
jgi:hypothetical protein